MHPDNPGWKGNMTPPPGYYRHYKGNVYLVHFLARETHTEEDVVIYSPCYPCALRYFTRPVKEWFEMVINPEGVVVQRFTAISSPNPPGTP